MPGLDAIPAEWQPLGTILFVIAIVIFGAWSRIFGKKQGPEAPKVQEFYAAGQMADMGPVKELVEQTGLLMQQQVRTNIALERIATAAEAALEALAEQREEQDREEEVERRVAERLAEEGVTPRRRIPRKTE